jgi:hypothetical protein
MLMAQEAWLLGSLDGSAKFHIFVNVFLFGGAKLVIIAECATRQA